jgi:hypothetical protein
MRGTIAAVTAIGMALGVAATTAATDIAVVPKKLIVVDKLVAASKAKTAFVAKDAAVTKGGGTDPDQISVQFDAVYGNGNAAGAFTLLAGASVNKSPGWVVNKDTVAKYVNKEAPNGPTEAKVAVIKPGKLLKLVGKGLGDTPFDVLGAGDPVGSVFTAYCVDNAGEENCHCSEFTGCVYKSIAGGTGAKMVCKSGSGDALCTAAGPATTTTTTSSTTTTTTHPAGFDGDWRVLPLDNDETVQASCNFLFDVEINPMTCSMTTSGGNITVDCGSGWVYAGTTTGSTFDASMSLYHIPDPTGFCGDLYISERLTGTLIGSDRWEGQSIDLTYEWDDSTWDPDCAACIFEPFLKTGNRL